GSAVAGVVTSTRISGSVARLKYKTESATSETIVVNNRAAEIPTQTLDERRLAVCETSISARVCASSIAMRASPMSRKRFRGSLVKQRRNSPSTLVGVLDGSAVQPGSFIIMAAMKNGRG